MSEFFKNSIVGIIILSIIASIIASFIYDNYKKGENNRKIPQVIDTTLFKNSTVGIIILGIIASIIGSVIYDNYKKKENNIKIPQVIDTTQVIDEQEKMTPYSEPKPSRPNITEEDKSQTQSPKAGRYITQSKNLSFEKVDAAVIAIDSEGSIDYELGFKIKSQLATKHIESDASLFTEAFVTDGLFSELQRGKSSRIKGLNLNTYANYLCLVSEKINYSSNLELGDTYTAVLDVKFSFLELNTGTLKDSFTLSARRAGGDKKDAYEGAYELIMRDLARKKITL